MAAVTLPGADVLREMAAADAHGHFRADDGVPDDPRFLNRELSWLAFNRRVLLEAAEPSLPLYERLRFLAIYGTNLDEFYMVRAGGLADRMTYRPKAADCLTGMTPKQQLSAIAAETTSQLPLLEGQYAAITEALAREGIVLLDAESLSDAERALAGRKFQALRELLTPQVFSRAQPLPFLRSREQYILVLLGRGKNRAVGLVPTTKLPRFVILPSDDGVTRIMPTPELVRAFAADLFPAGKAEETAILRVTRNAEIRAGDVLDNPDADDRAVMERLLRARRRLECVRAQVSASASDRMIECIRAELKLPKKRVFRCAAPLDLSFVHRLDADVIPERLRRAPTAPAKTVQLKKGMYFDYLAQDDLLIALPYQRIDPLVDLLYEAADAPDVTRVRMTLYRLAGSSRIAAALAYAAAQGKHVSCVLELRARFDEQNNLDYSRMLADSGCEIHYGLPNYKVHAKLCLIERETPDGTRYYTQVGTGNYNEATAEQYTDLMLLTGDEQIGRDAKAVFDALERKELPGKTERLLLSPTTFKPWLLARIAEQAALGKEGRIRIQCNALNDPEIMTALAGAAQSGAETELLVRGICCLRPGTEGFSEGLKIRSIVGRYLEHQRIYCFGRGAATRVWIGSGDLLERNTMRRVEAFVEVTRPRAKEEVLALLEFLRLDDKKAWTMHPDGWYTRPEPRGRFDSQAALHDYFAARLVTPPAPKTKPAPEPPRPASPAPAQPDSVRALVPVVPATEPRESFWRRILRWLKEN